MTTTFLKRQKEMKRLDKQRAKAERRAQKKLAKGLKNEALTEPTPGESAATPAAPESQD